MVNRAGRTTIGVENSLEISVMTLVQRLAQWPLAAGSGLAALALSPAPAMAGSPIELVPAAPHAPAPAPRWTIRDAGQLAVISASDGTFAAVQCDPYAGDARRFLFGRSGRDRSAAPVGPLAVETRSASLSARFALAAEDRGETEFGGTAHYIAASLTAQQLAALGAANTISVQLGDHAYAFSGAGSDQAMRALTCPGTARHSAQRLILARHPDEPLPLATPWQLVRHRGANALTEGRSEIFATVSNHPADPDSRYRLAVACAADRLTLRFGADSTAPSAAGWAGRDPDHLLELYRQGHLVRTIVVPDHGHVLKPAERADLAAADQLLVAGEGQAIEFSTRALASTAGALANACMPTAHR